jgi:hypothetical protein
MYDSFGGFPQFGQQFGQQQPFGGFGGMQDYSQMLPMGDQMGGGMFGKPKKKQGGFNPLMLSPLAYAFSKDPKVGLAMLSPGIGIANLLGAFK